MSEVQAHNGEYLNPTDAISSVFYDWLDAEIKNSMSGQNAYLDKWDTFLKDGAAKVNGHYDRLNLWTDAFSAQADDASIVRQLYGVQTGLSGAFRTQCYVLAASHDDYLRRREFHGPLGINIKDHTSSHLAKRFVSLPTSEDLILPVVDAESLAKRTLQVNNFRLQTMRELHANVSQKPDKMMKRLHDYIALHKLQAQWLALGIDYVLFAAQQHEGDLAKVPMLEPKPITDAETYYPFN